MRSTLKLPDEKTRILGIVNHAPENPSTDSNFKKRTDALTAKIAELTTKRQIKLTALEAALTACVADPGIGAKALKGLRTGSPANIENPAALKYLLTAYERAQGALPPSLEALKEPLKDVSLPDSKTSYTELATWCRENYGKLAEYAAADYSLKCLTESQGNIPTATDIVDPQKHGWLLTEDFEEQKEADDAQLKAITETLESPAFKEKAFRKRSQQLMKDIEHRIEQLHFLQQSLQASRDEKLIEEYRVQRALLSEELNALVKSCNLPSWRPPAKETKELQKAAHHFSGETAEEIHIESGSGYLTHYEKTREGGLKKTIVLNQDGTPFTPSPEEIQQALAAFCAERKEHGLSNPLSKLHGIYQKLSPSHIQFASPEDKEAFIQFLKQFDAKLRGENKKALSEPATPSPASVALVPSS